MQSLDTETSLISDHEPIPRMVCAQTSDSEAVEVIHHNDPECPAIVEALLSEPCAFANAPFDLCVVEKRYLDLSDCVWGALEDGRICDVATRERLLDLADGKGLKREYGLGPVSKRNGFTVDKRDPWRLRYVELIDTPVSRWPAAALNYARQDALVTSQIADKQAARAQAFADAWGPHPLVDAPRQARAHWALYLSSRHGVLTDPARVAALDASLRREQEALARELAAHGLLKSNGARRMDRVRAMIVEVCHPSEPEETETGEISTSEETLLRLDLPPGHVLEKYQRYGSIMGLRSRVVRSLEKPVLRTRWTELMENGRTSTSEPQLQNLPTEGGFRECLVPDEGNLFVIADYPKAELVSWAQVLLEIFGEDHRCAALAKALREGIDVHSETASAIGDLGEGLPPPRRLAKIAIFGFMGGMGLQRFCDNCRKEYSLRITLDQARMLRDAVSRRWALDAYLAHIGGLQDKETGWIDLIQFRSGRVQAGCGFTDAANSLFSGLTADATKDCLWRLAKAMYKQPQSPLYGARQVLFVHDENVLECKAERAEAVAAELERIMCETYQEWCPDVPMRSVDLKICDRYPDKPS